MATSYIPLYKTIILYLLMRAESPLTRAQVMDFVLGEEYTNFLTFNETMGELVRQKMIEEEKEGARTFLHVTPIGRDTLSAVQGQIRPDITQQIDNFLTENRLELRNDSAIRADYRMLANGAYEVTCGVWENNRRLYGLQMEMPTEELAEKACDAWRNESGEIYRYLIGKLT